MGRSRLATAQTPAKGTNANTFATVCTQSTLQPSLSLSLADPHGLSSPSKCPQSPGASPIPTGILINRELPPSKPSRQKINHLFPRQELCEIYQGSPLSRQPTNPDDNTAGNRKPIEDDCPICFMEFEPAKEEIVWCKAACGNNIHKPCFDKWAATQRAQGVRCVFW